VDLLFAALTELLDPLRFSMLIAGVLLGLVIGVIPGLGGVFGLTVLVPVTYTLDPISAFALLLGMSSVTTTSDTIPAVLLGVPGTVGSAATAIDGHELAKQGQAARALGAAYSASLIGGTFGALLLALALPVMRPIVLLFNFGDLLAITLFGLTLVALLSGGNQLRGLLAALMGVLVSFIGLDPYESHERWTFGEIYLWEGVPTAILFLGLFGVSELAGLLRRGRIQQVVSMPSTGEMWRGMGETIRHWPLVLKCSALGSLLGAIPGVGVTVIEWIAYGESARRPGNGPPFGEGNIRGVIAPESANNSKEGGALLPTLAFGIPGSATMAILLGAFAIHGLVPGPDLLTDNAPLLVTMILTIAAANLLATGICLGMTPTLARIARVPATSLVPLALVFVVLGAFHSNKDPLDIVILLIFGFVGIMFKRLGWSRPAFALGFVLGPNLERFFFLSYQISGWNWLTQPFVLVMLAVAVATMVRQAAGWRKGRKAAIPDPYPRASLGVTLGIVGLVLLCLLTTIPMPAATRLFPVIVCGPALMIGAGLLFQAWNRSRRAIPTESLSADFRADLTLLVAVAGLGILLLTFGHLASPFLFVLLAAGYFRKPSPAKALLSAIGVTIVNALVFDVLIDQSWPTPLVLMSFE
jgi:putative tricarboxylic transport membrane protein